MSNIVPTFRLKRKETKIKNEQLSVKETFVIMAMTPEFMDQLNLKMFIFFQGCWDQLQKKQSTTQNQCVFINSPHIGLGLAGNCFVLFLLEGIRFID